MCSFVHVSASLLSDRTLQNLVSIIYQLRHKKAFIFLCLSISNNDIPEARNCEGGALIASITFKVLK
jgi:hypothetical protein